MSITDIGSVASILGFLLTILIFLSLRIIRRFYVFIARVPELLSKLIEHAGEISKYQKEFSDSQQEIELELSKAEVVLKSLKKKVGRQTKSSINKVLKTVKTYNNNSFNDSKRLWKVYVKIQILIDEINELQSDNKWKR
jgi:predicted PurR-regulated permease PerM